MKISIVFFMAIMLVGCSAVQEPKEQEVKQVVMDWYAQQSSLDGGGAWDVSGITVLSIERDPGNKKTFQYKMPGNGYLSCTAFSYTKTGSTVFRYYSHKTRMERGEMDNSGQLD